jgi:uncharacterized protein
VPVQPRNQQRQSIDLMITKLIATFLVLFTHFSFGQNHPGTVLWEVTKPGIKHTSYLFGTMHEVNPDFFDALPNSVNKLKTAERVYLERVKSVPGNTTGAGRLLVWDSQKWNKLLKKDQKTIFESFVKKAEDSVYYRMAPLVLLRSLGGIYIQNFCDTTGRKSSEQMDRRIENLAIQNRKIPLSLDEDQTNILLKSTTDDYLFLEAGYAAECVDLMDKMLRDDTSKCKVIEDYKAFNLDYQFQKEINHLQIPSPFLLERNNKWMITLDKAFGEASCFVAVGIGHLYLKEGLIQQLRAHGYQVVPVSAR